MLWNSIAERHVPVPMTVLEESMKLEWHKPVVTEQGVGLEVTSYLTAELDRS
jgi:coenzyme PQQ precursor peptide PqqA